MRHIRPDKWADAVRGQVTEAQRARMDRHASACERCAAARARVERSVEAFADIRAQEPEDLRWEHIGARIYWVTSSERRTGRQAARLWQKRWFAPAAVAVAVAAVALIGALGLAGFGDDGGGQKMAESEALAPGQHTEPIGAPTVAETPAPRPAAQPLSGVVTFMEGDITRNGAPLAFDTLIEPGDRLQTTAGRVAVQFGQKESFTLNSDSALTLTAFDDQQVQLDLTGEIVIDISHRRPDQTFAVHAGGKHIEVRGTRFSVRQRADGLRVACSEGEVAVIGDADELSVPAGRVARWLGNAPSLDEMAPAEVEDLGRWLFQVPTFTTARELRASTSKLSLAGTAKEPVEIDGQLMGDGAFVMRMTPGRHLARRGSDSGSWVGLNAGQSVDAETVAPQVAAAESPARRRARAHSKRRTQLNRALSGGTRLNGCVRALRKQGLLSSAFIELELGVSSAGTIGYLNIVDSNLSADTAACIRDAVDGIQFGKGPSASWQHRIEW